MLLRSLRFCLLLVAACSATPAAPVPPPSASTLDRARQLRAQGEYLEATTLLRTMLLREPDRRDVAQLLREIEISVGVEGLPAGPETRSRLLLVEVLGHIASARALLERGDRAGARAHVDRAVAEIERHRLQAKFPRALSADLEELRRKADQ